MEEPFRTVFVNGTVKVFQTEKEYKDFERGWIQEVNSQQRRSAIVNGRYDEYTKNIK